jgi:AraC family transcriptional regulator
MEPQIELLKEKKVVGCNIKMSLTKNKTFELWRHFMPLRKDIKNSINNNLISLRVYQTPLITPTDFQREFIKWATVEVSQFDAIPKHMQSLTIEEGLYAKFDYKGLNTDTSIFDYIYSKWMPKSMYNLDHRPHFEVLGEKYKNNDVNSEEEIWIPIKLKA